MEAALEITRVTVALVLLWAGTAKLQHLGDWLGTFRRWGVGRGRAADTTAVALAASEVAVGAVLLLGMAPSITAWLAAALCALFVIVSAVGLRASMPLPCGCFGDLSETVTSWSMVRALVLMGMSLVVALTSAYPSTITADSLVMVATAGGLAVLLREWTSIGLAWSFLRAPVPAQRVPTMRVSFRHLSMTQSLFSWQEPGDSSLEPDVSAGRGVL